MKSRIEDGFRSVLRRAGINKLYHRYQPAIMSQMRILCDLVDKRLGINGKQRPILITRNITDAQLNDLKERWQFYVPQLPADALEVKSYLEWRDVLSRRPILLFGELPLLAAGIRRYRPEVFDIDYRRNPTDGWEWCGLAQFYSPTADLCASKQRFKEYVDALRKQQLEICYVFGTGPSLENAIERDWSDGYRIVCNTIVRDPVLWQHLNPHFIVAGDAIYHFGHTAFARAFRKDLKERLSETQTFFVYPDGYDGIVRRELGMFSERLIPIPLGEHARINVDLTRNFTLPIGLGNVLAMILLPLACTLSRKVGLWGFDGRAPNDKLFWGNSDKHSYPELIPDLQRAHPHFFEYHVPKEEPNRYVKEVHGDLLDERLGLAEREGHTFVMLHSSWTPTFQKRYRQS